jgi:hypothetical protein
MAQTRNDYNINQLNTSFKTLSFILVILCVNRRHQMIENLNKLTEEL